MTKGNQPERKFIPLLEGKGVAVELLWDLKGPKDTQITWLSAYALDHSMSNCIIITTFEHGGWDVLVQASRSNVILDTLNAVLANLQAAKVEKAGE